MTWLCAILLNILLWTMYVIMAERTADRELRFWEFIVGLGLLIVQATIGTVGVYTTLVWLS